MEKRGKLWNFVIAGVMCPYWNEISVPCSNVHKFDPTFTHVKLRRDFRLTL